MRLILQILFVSICAANACLAQQPASGDPLANLVTQNKAAFEQLASERKKAVASPAKAYLDALDSVSALAVKSGNTGVESAVERERLAVVNAEDLPAKPLSDLPSQVYNARRAYLSAAKSASQAQASKVTAQAAQFSRSLGALEAEARLKGDKELISRIGEERQRANASLPTANVVSGFRKNLVRNGDFSENATTRGSPAGWTGEDAAASVQMDGVNPFLHLSGKSVEQIILLPAGTQSVRVQCRLRSNDLQEVNLPGEHRAGVRIHFEEASGHHIRHEFIAEMTGPQRAWKRFSETKILPPSAARLRLIVFREGMDGSLDADDFSVEALNR